MNFVGIAKGKYHWDVATTNRQGKRRIQVLIECLKAKAHFLRSLDQIIHQIFDEFYFT